MKGMFYKLIGVFGTVIVPLFDTANAAVTANNNSSGFGLVLKNAGGFIDQLGWAAIGLAGLIGLFLFFGGLLKVNKHFKQQGGQQESIMGPVVMAIVGILLMSLVAVKGAATTTIFGTNAPTQFNQTTGGVGAGRGF